MNNNLGASIDAMTETPKQNDILSAIGYDESAIKTSDDASQMWKKVFEHWDKTYPDNQKMSAKETNELWANGYQDAYNTIEKKFDSLAKKEWNKSHPEYVFNKELNRYQIRPTENLVWDEEAGEWR